MTSGRQRLHDGSTGDWVTHLGGLGKGRGRRVVARAHALSGPLTATRVAMAAGRVSLEQAGVWDASDLARAGRHLVHVVDPDTTDRRLERQLAREERASHLDRYLALTFNTAGGCGSRAAGPPRTAPSSRPRCCH